MTNYIIAEKGDEVISERHQKDFKKEETNEETSSAQNFTDVSFDDI